MQCLVQINFTTRVPVAEFARHSLDVAEVIAGQAGLVWKIWLINEVRNEAGGWYLFATEAQATAYLEGRLVAALRDNPVVADLSAKLFRPDPGPTGLTRGLPVLGGG